MCLLVCTVFSSKPIDHSVFFMAPSPVLLLWKVFLIVLHQKNSCFFYFHLMSGWFDLFVFSYPYETGRWGPNGTYRITLIDPYWNVQSWPIVRIKSFLQAGLISLLSVPPADGLAYSALLKNELLGAGIEKVQDPQSEDRRLQPSTPAKRSLFRVGDFRFASTFKAFFPFIC